MTNSHTYEGGCHCGAVRFELRVDPSGSRRVHECNCSICAMKGFIHMIVEKDTFRLLEGEDFLTSYRFNTEVANHLFCRVCGVQSFYHPRSHPEGISVNLRCLPEELVQGLEIVPFDGQNWEENVARIRARKKS